MTLRRAWPAMLLVWACAARGPREGRVWESYVGDGPLRVHGARWNDPGPRVYRAIATDPAGRRVLGGKAEPDSLRVRCRRDGGARVILSYVRGPRELVVDPAGTVCGRARPARGGAGVRRPGGDDKPPPPGEVASADSVPTARQGLECPIDPTRAECRIFCRTGAIWEWCRAPHR